jgi:hypothetical protein
MAASKTERRVYLWKLKPRAIPAHDDEHVTLEEILGLLQGEFLSGLARVFLSKDSRILEDDATDADPKQQIYIADIKRSATRHNLVTILINRGDPDAVSPAFINSETDDVRIEHPGEKESPGWSAHLAISLAVDGHGAHRACFEKMPRVSSTLVTNAIDKIVSRVAARTGTYTYTYSFRSNKKIVHEQRRFRPVLGLHKIPSEKLSSDLDAGSLTGVTLTKRKHFYDGVGAGNLVKRQEEKIVISTRPADKGVIRSFIAGITEKAKEEGYEDISFHVGDLPGNTTATATMSLDEADAMEALYVRAQRVTDFDAILEACYSAVCPQIESKLIEIINATDFGGNA